MNKNLKEKLHEAVEAHKKGFLKDAEIAYNYILENDSKSSDANNNLGLIKVSNFESIESAAKQMIASIREGGKVISCGNGGSMSDAMHFAEEMTGRFRENRGPWFFGVHAALKGTFL